MNHSRLSIFVFGLIACMVGSASADIYLHLDGMTGSMTETNHVGWMNIDSVQHGLGRQTTIQGAGVTSYSEITCAKSLDSASPLLALYAAGGGSNIIKSGTIDFVSTTNQQCRYLRANLTNILISSYSQSTGGETPEETFSLAPEIVSWNYVQYSATSGLPDGYAYNLWNIVAGTAKYGTNNPLLVTSGIRLNSGVQLNWSATNGHTYCVYAVNDLSHPFIPVATVTADTTGDFSYQFTPTAPAMFYTVREVPSGY